MDTNPAFIRRLCLAKRAELAGDREAACKHLAVATGLVGCLDQKIQIAAWVERLNSEPFGLLPAQPAKRRKAKVEK